MKNPYSDLEPRIPPAEVVPPEVAEALGKTLLTPDQRPLNIFLTLAIHPALLKRLNIYTGLFMGRGLLPARTRELLVLRVAHRIECAYEWEQHVGLARRLSISEAEIAAVGESPSDHQWSEEDRACLSLCDEVLDRADVSDVTWSAVRAGPWSDAQIEEMILLVGCYRMIGGLLKGLRVPLDNFVVGVEG